MRRALAYALLLSAVHAANSDECAADGGLCAASSLTTLDDSHTPGLLLEAARTTEMQTFVSGLYRALHRCVPPQHLPTA
jgi:hypothetical protein